MSDDVQIIHGDCLEVMPTLDLGPDVAVVTDPPYGMGWNTDSTRYSGGQSKGCRYRGMGRTDWGDIEGDSEPFDPSPWLNYSKVILWGANYFARRLPVGTTLVWIKKGDHHFGTFLSDAEIAWMKGGHGTYCFRKLFPPPCRIQEGGLTKRAAHPTQKPLALMRWCIGKLNLSEGATIIDPYAGSGTTLVAAMQMGYRAIGIEKAARYIPIIKRRIAEARKPLFDLIEA